MMTDHEIITIKEYIDIKIDGLKEDINACRTDIKDMTTLIVSLQCQADYSKGKTAGKEWMIGVGVAVGLSILSLVIALV